MSVTIGLVANVYNEIHALPGWLETHLPFFDDVQVLHAGPQGDLSTDGTLDLLRDWRVPVTFCAIDAGFGAVRTAALRLCPCDYVMLLDADERFHPLHRVVTCCGESTPPGEVDAILQSYDLRDPDRAPPDWDRIGKLGADLRTDIGEVYNQGARLREILENHRPDAVLTCRRHWHDLTFRRPTQNWLMEPDWQARLVRRSDAIRFSTETRMHERLIGAHNLWRADMERGPFFDHYHFWYKRMEPHQRAHDIRIYDAIDRGESPPTQR